MDIDWKGALDADAKALPKLIERAEAGNHEVALRLFDIFTARVNSGREPYPELLNYLSKCFAKLLSGAERDANKALNLGKPRHRRVRPLYNVQLMQRLENHIDRFFPKIDPSVFGSEPRPADSIQCWPLALSISFLSNTSVV
jgi:hypothetical protein